MVLLDFHAVDRYSHCTASSQANIPAWFGHKLGTLSALFYNLFCGPRATVDMPRGIDTDRSGSRNGRGLLRGNGAIAETASKFGHSAKNTSAGS